MSDTRPAAERDDERLWRYVVTWRRACEDFVALARSIGGDDADRPTDLPGWSVRDNVAHTAHLESVLAGAPEETLQFEPGPHVSGLRGLYLEQGVRARQDRGLGDLADEIERAVAVRYAELSADPPSDPRGTPARTPGGVPWDNETLLRNRPLDVWMHEQDIRRALGRPGGYDSPAAVHTVAQLMQALGMVLGKRAGAPAGTSLTVEVPELGLAHTVLVGDDGRARPAETSTPTARITLAPEAFVVLAGGRRTPSDLDGELAPRVEGDVALAESVLSRIAVTP